MLLHPTRQAECCATLLTGIACLHLAHASALALIANPGHSIVRKASAIIILLAPRLYVVIIGLVRI